MSSNEVGFEGTSENADLNQYWYSTNTITALVKEVEAQTVLGAAFLSCPSLYFALKDDTVRQLSKVFEYDRQWDKDPGFVFYDYNKPEEFNIALYGEFDVVVIDPPFITEECWKCYAETARRLLAPGGKVICTTIVENEGIMAELLGCTPVAFRPSIPNLVYQYNTYTSYHPTKHLEVGNPEIVEDDANVAKTMQRDMLESRDQFISMAVNRPGREDEQAIPVNRVAKNSWDNVPVGLTEYPEGGPEETPVAVAYGPEYDATFALRARVAEVSKAIDRACKPLDKAWKARRTAAKAAAKGGDEAAEAKAAAELEEARKIHVAQLKEIESHLAAFPDERYFCAVLFVCFFFVSCHDSHTHAQGRPDLHQCACCSCPHAR